MKRAALLALLLGCAGGRLGQIRATGAAALGCPGDSLWVIDDGDGWSAAGCGQIASGLEPEHAMNVSAASCEALAQFEYRMCLLIARQRASSAGAETGNLAAQGMEATDGEACRDRLKSRTDTCLRTPPPRQATPPGEPAAPATEAPAATP